MSINKISLKSGKILEFPCMFINLKNNSEAEILRIIEARYPQNTNHNGINNIEGLSVSIKDWQDISKYFSMGYIINEPQYRLKDRVLIIDPSLYILFSGTENDKTSLLSTISQSFDIQKVVTGISNMPQKNKSNQNIDELYPLLDTKFIRMLLEYQIKNHGDIIISPSTPITSLNRIEEQIEKSKEMNRISKILFDTVFSAVKDERDLMHVLSLRLSALKSNYIEELKEAVLINNPDQIGIRIMGLDEGNTSQIWSLLNFIQELSQSNKPIHIFNVREFGYVTYCYGAKSITTPIASDPYFVRAISNEPVPRRGAFYHPKDMTDDSYDILLAKTRSNNYTFPCYCEICERFGKIMSVNKPDWNEFRRIHFLLVKNMEIKELKTVKVSIKEALKDKFARSQQTTWLPYLD